VDEWNGEEVARTGGAIETTVAARGARILALDRAAHAARGLAAASPSRGV
jgi:hypothetical protein